MYRKGCRDNPPHIFGLAYTAYHNMVSENENQSIVISNVKVFALPNAS